MAAICINHSLCTSKRHHAPRDGGARRPMTLLSCWGKRPQDNEELKTKKKKDEGTCGTGMKMQKGKGLKEMPEKKGDVKDLVLMSLSFAVYVYISEQIVSAYFAWLSLPNPSW